MKHFFCDNKNLITIAVLILGLGAYVWSYLTSISAENIITAIVSGLFGMGTGAALARMKNERTTDSEEPKP